MNTLFLYYIHSEPIILLLLRLLSILRLNGLVITFGECAVRLVDMVHTWRLIFWHSSNESLQITNWFLSCLSFVLILDELHLYGKFH